MNAPHCLHRAVLRLPVHLRDPGGARPLACSGAPIRSGSRRDYVAMLEATGTGTPAQLLARCGLDVDDPDVWHQSLAELDRLCRARLVAVRSGLEL